jgi:hypothetical protein
MVPVPLAAAGALAGGAYLKARFTLAHDLLFLRISSATLFSLFRAVRADKVNVFYILEKQALDKATARKPFVLFEGKSYTYAETYETVLRYGVWLRERQGVRERDIVALDYQNSETFIFLWLAIWAIGAKPAFINHNLHGAALAHCLRESTAKLAIVDPCVAESVTEDVRQELPRMNFVVFTAAVESEARSHEPVRYPDVVRTESEYVNMAILIYTSGTTGMPKPAVVSWAKVYMASNMSAKGTGSTPNDIFYTVCYSHVGRRKGCWVDKGEPVSHFYIISACPFTTAPHLAWRFAARCFSEPPRPLGAVSRPRPSGRRCAKPTRPSSSMWARHVGTSQSRRPRSTR